MTQGGVQIGFGAMGLSHAAPSPEGWENRRLRFLARINKPDKLELSPETEVSFVPMAAIGENGGLQLCECKALDEIGDGYTPFVEGDVVIAKITPCFENGKGALAEGLQNGVAFGTTELHVIQPGERIDRRFLFYLSISELFRKLGEGVMYGAGGQKRVPDRFIKDFRAPVPPVSTQEKIADFLDRKTAEIGTLIAKKRRLLDLLTEKRTALITHAVTKGLDPDATMKDSGIEWLGEIPAHWEVKKLKFIGELLIGLTYSPSDVCSVAEGTLVLRASNIQRGRIALNDNVYVDAEVPDKLRTKIGDILICSRNGSQKLVGKAAIIDEQSSGLTFGAFNTVLRSAHGHYLFYLFASGLVSQQAGLYQTSTIFQLTTGMLKEFQVPVPPSKDQERIIAYIQKQLVKHDKVAEKVGSALRKLQEYRSALITNAVTGQINVA